jgi:CheY-like chemotaxis protein
MKNVLLVSTDTDVLNLIKANSPFFNFNVLPETSNDLLAKLRHSKPDLLIIDLILNENNGGGLCHQIKCDPELRYLPVILLSDYTNMEHLSAKFGCNVVLNKPFDISSLKEILDALPSEHSV